MTDSIPSLDYYQLPLSSSSGEAIDSCLQGVQASLTFDASGIDALRAAISLDPGFALAHAMLAKQQSIHGQQSAAMDSLAQALASRNTASAQEASQISVLAAVLQNNCNALRLAQEHLRDWPLDVIVLACIAGPFGLLAFSGEADWQIRCADFLQQLESQWPADDWWFLTTLAFALAETGQLQRADMLAQRAWQLNPNGNCAHTLSHVQFEQGALSEGISFVDQWCDQYGGQSDMRHHLQWHRALFKMDLGLADPDGMHALYQREFDPSVADPMPLTTYSDNASFVWRCYIYGMPLADGIARSALHYGQQYFPQPGFGFADLHTVALLALLDSPDETDRMQAQIDQLEDSGYRHTLQALWQGFSAFAEGRYVQAAGLLEPRLTDVVCLGGSNAQRRIVEETCQRAKTLAANNAGAER